MSYHSCLITHVLSLMSCLSCLSMTMTHDHHDLWLTTHHSWLSHPTIIHDHHSWSSGLITWLLTHDFSLMAIKVFSPMTMTYHRWLSLLWPSSMSMTSSLRPRLLTYDFSPNGHAHPMTMKCPQWPSGHSPMTIRMVSNVHFGPLLWSAHMDYLMGEYDVHYDRHIYFDRHIHCAWGEYEYESMREYERMRVWYPLIKMTEMIEMIEMIETTKEGQKRFWWYFLNIVCFLVFLCIVVWVWVVSGVFVECVLVGVGDWYKRSWVGKWVAPAILGD